tara:strand:- start:20224 stop:20424 length:201 start_codon:yes stop_codon:yes gene_type:complete
MRAETHKALVTLGDRFCRELGELTGNILAELPADEHDEALVYLQDRTSLYSPFTADIIRDVAGKQS